MSVGLARPRTKQDRLELREVIYKLKEEGRITTYGSLTIQRYDCETDRPCVRVWIGTAAHPAHHHSFRTVERREDWISEQEQSEKSSQDYKKQRQHERLKPHGLKAGDVLYTSWGYDQTNIDFYQVTRKQGKRTVFVRPIASAFVDSPAAPGGMCGYVKACPNQFTGPETRHMANYGYITIDRHSGCAWDGHPVYCSWYA